MEQQEIFEKVRACLVEALDVEPDEVQLKAKLTEDLEAESIDFVDIIYRLEQTFSVKIPQGDLFPQDLLSKKEFVDSGAFTSEGLGMLREQYPFLDLGSAEALKVSELPNLYTVDMLVKYVDRKVS